MQMARAGSFPGPPGGSSFGPGKCRTSFVFAGTGGAAWGRRGLFFFLGPLAAVIACCLVPRVSCPVSRVSRLVSRKKTWLLSPVSCLVSPVSCGLYALSLVSRVPCLVTKYWLLSRDSCLVSRVASLYKNYLFLVQSILEIKI